MAKNTNALMSGAGWILSFTDLLTKALLERGCSPEEIHSLVTETKPAKQAIGTIADAVASIIQTVKKFFRVVVDYSKTLDEMIAAGLYDWKNDNINAKNFPVDGKGTSAVNVELIHFNRTIESNEALNELDKMGYRPATLPELLAFGAKYPDKQREFPIIALGSVWRRLDFRCVACLVCGGGRRGLRLRWLLNGWRADDRFAAVRK